MEKYWRSLDELKNGPESQSDKLAEGQHKNAVLDLIDGEAAESKASRRNFLKIMGFSFATAALATSCEKPIQKPFLTSLSLKKLLRGKPITMLQVFFDGNEYCSIVAKVRDGRPIKIEANKLSKVSLGGDIRKSPGFNFEFV